MKLFLFQVHALERPSFGCLKCCGDAQILKVKREHMYDTHYGRDWTWIVVLQRMPCQNVRISYHLGVLFIFSLDVLIMDD